LRALNNDSIIPPQYYKREEKTNKKNNAYTTAPCHSQARSHPSWYSIRKFSVEYKSIPENPEKPNPPKLQKAKHKLLKVIFL